jgi:hypothetical protein
MSIATSVAARLKLKRTLEAPASEPAPKRSELEPMRPAALAGDTVLGNFKGLAETDEDWEEAIIVSVAADGFKAPGVVVSYTTDPDIQNSKKFLALGLQTAAGVPLQCDERPDFMSFRIGLFGL